VKQDHTVLIAMADYTGLLSSAELAAFIVDLEIVL
jgi:hypothetical protein